MILHELLFEEAPTVALDNLSCTVLPMIISFAGLTLEIIADLQQV